MISLKRFRYIVSLLILSLSPSLFGQAVNATLLGTITDSTGATVPGAKVTATETTTGLIHESVTNESGNYTFPDMPPGKYSITSEAKGFKKDTHQNIDLLSNSSTRVDVEMVTGSVSEEVLVTTSRYQHKDRSKTGCRPASRHESQLPVSSQYSSRHGACDLPALTVFQCGEFVTDRGERHASHGQSLPD